MRRTTIRWTLGLALLVGGLTLGGCAGNHEEAAPDAKTLEHTTSKPPPGVLENQQAQAKAQAADQRQTSGAGR